MSLYLCVFQGDEELEGVEVGAYEDFDAFRDLVARVLENGQPASRFPVLMKHSNCEGAWSAQEARALQEELLIITRELQARPPMPLDDLQREILVTVGRSAESLADCVFDVDGVPLTARLLQLCAVAQQTNLPILFQ